MRELREQELDAPVLVDPVLINRIACDVQVVVSGDIGVHIHLVGVDFLDQSGRVDDGAVGGQEVVPAGAYCVGVLGHGGDFDVCGVVGDKND
jgi:hypothetical protein